MNSGITVVLTAFKRVESLAEQLAAIKKQSIIPEEIWLFQDKVVGNYTITIDENLLAEFDNVYIAKENVGVWGRFDYARRAKTEYICIFDDDTIPGSRWLENCMTHMQEQEGVYGTIGVVFLDPEKYTKGGHYRIGWDRPNETTKEVDLVGHSWFLKREWLEYMFNDTAKYAKYKYAAEDMSLSFACLKHNIHTYVPPHPPLELDFWGSQPDSAMTLGNASVALSKGKNNTVMNEAATELVNEGWNILIKRDAQYVKKGWKKEKRNRWKERWIIIKTIVKMILR